MLPARVEIRFKICYTDSETTKQCEVIVMFELELLTDSAAASSRTESCVPDCPCQPDQRENECWPYFADEPEQNDAAAE